MQEAFPPIHEQLPPATLVEQLPPSSTVPVHIRRIVDEVGRKYVPQDLDYRGLEAAIDLSISHYLTLVETDKFLDRYKSRIESRRAAIEKRRELLELEKEIDDDDWDARHDWPRSWSQDWVIRKYEIQIEQLELERSLGGPYWEEAHKQGLDYAIFRRQCELWTPLEWLAGCFLAKDFETYFGGRTPGTTPTGPYARFAVQVLKEYCIENGGEFYKGATIGKALDDLRHNRGKRKPPY